MLDPEIEAITQCHEHIKILDDDSKIRVIQWLISKFQLNSQPTYWVKGQSTVATNGSDSPKALPVVSPENKFSEGDDLAIVIPTEKTIESYNTVADFFAEFSLSYDWEKTLIVSTYLQIKNGMADFTSFEVNKELKNLGHASSNITEAFDACISRKPQLILQVRKEGNYKQARKKYKVSNEGIKLVKTMLQKGVDTE